jgi:hypothetical protein
MTVIIHYWFESFASFLPLAFYAGIMIGFSIFLIKAGLEKEDGKESIYNLLLIAAGAINIVSVVIIFLFPSNYISYSTITPAERLIINWLFYILPALVSNIPRIFSFGVIFIAYGYRSNKLRHKYLAYAGLSWLVYFILASIVLINPVGFYTSLSRVLVDIHGSMDGIYVSFILDTIFGTVSIFNLLGAVFLLIHGFLQNDRLLKIAGLIYFFGNALFGLSIIPYYLERILV